MSNKFGEGLDQQAAKQRLRTISGGETMQDLTDQGRVRENNHGVIHGRVVPSEVHQGERQSS